MSNRPHVLLESWLPFDAVGVESIRESGFGTPFPGPVRLHVWWARRPLTISRAAVVASLLPDYATVSAHPGLRQRFSTESLLYISQMLWDTLRRVKESAQSRMPLELAMVKLAQTDSLQPLTKILQRLEALETRLGTAPARASASATPAAMLPPARPPDDARTGPPPKQPPAPAHKPPPHSRPPNARQASRAAQAHEQALDAQRQIQERAAQNPVVSEALRILQGTVVKVEK